MLSIAIIHYPLLLTFCNNVELLLLVKSQVIPEEAKAFRLTILAALNIFNYKIIQAIYLRCFNWLFKCKKDDAIYNNHCTRTTLIQNAQGKEFLLRMTVRTDETEVRTALAQDVVLPDETDTGKCSRRLEKRRSGKFKMAGKDDI